MKKCNFVKKTIFCTEFCSTYENDAHFDYFGAPGPQKDDDDDDDDDLEGPRSRGSGMVNTSECRKETLAQYRPPGSAKESAAPPRRFLEGSKLLRTL